ncbi:UDP-N-acetylglucosamine--N-acetylmuramyl-(pentapeptide) pyrophosphoryl-undecaprenol N-acetylglucosamine transferase [Candidatus Microgenomates bacterium]|nr:MAG: UDP-N-acetylglucosamine--N-acetylmuramyl-(pentapeptide) pyrophosphoryl-undecaprenol N-acetylglucosamine transferase [Candidatus Microgenomates bacterium]
MKIVLTGGHLSPLLSVIDTLPKEAEILVVGRKKALEGDIAFSLEYQTLEEKKIPFKSIVTGRWQRRFTKHTIFSFFKIPVGFFQSFFILKKFKPDVVLSFGSYVSLPVTFTAFILSIPVVLHEQTLEAGLSNRIAGFFAKKICISWKSSEKFFPKLKTVLTGNPVREFGIKKQELRINNNDGLPVIYITGGSLGSHAINVLVEGCLEKLLEKFIVFHQTGDAKEFEDFKRLEKIKASLPQKLQERYNLTKFVEPEKVGSIIYSSSFVVSRSGINTITELFYFGKPSILIPLPFSQNNEQFKNALFFKEAGFGEILDQEKADSKDLYDRAELMLNNLDKYKQSAENAKNQINKDAAEEIVKVLNNYAKN